MGCHQSQIKSAPRSNGRDGRVAEDPSADPEASLDSCARGGGAIRAFVMYHIFQMCDYIRNDFLHIIILNIYLIFEELGILGRKTLWSSSVQIFLSSLTKQTGIKYGDLHLNR